MSAAATSPLAERIRAGFVVESLADTDEAYRRALRETLIVSGDTEFVSAAVLWTALDRAPSLNSQMALLAVIQDELGHAHIAYRLLADLGEDVDALVYGRAARQFKNPYAFDFARALGGVPAGKRAVRSSGVHAARRHPPPTSFGRGSARWPRWPRRRTSTSARRTDRAAGRRF